MNIDQIRARLEISNITKIAREIPMSKSILFRIKSGTGRGPHKRSLEAIKEYFLKVDSGYKFK